MEGGENVPQKMSKKNIEGFLLEMKEIITNERFDIDRQFQFIQQRENNDPNDEYTNQNTLLELEYDRFDVINELKTLTVKNYCESVYDTLADGICFLHVFGKRIQDRDIYIKVRIKTDHVDKRVFCISFHFARHPLANFPYR